MPLYPVRIYLIEGNAEVNATLDCGKITVKPSDGKTRIEFDSGLELELTNELVEQLKQALATSENA
jgi:hypothetical protein